MRGVLPMAGLGKRVGVSGYVTYVLFLEIPV